MSSLDQQCGKAHRIGDMHSHCTRKTLWKCPLCRCSEHGGPCANHRKGKPFINRALLHYIETTSLLEI